MRQALFVAFLLALPSGAAVRSRGESPGRRIVIPRFYKPSAKPPAGSRHYFDKLISEPNYREFRDATVELLGRYPPDRHYFIGVGRSPAPIIALLQNIDEGLARNFPASGLRIEQPERLLREHAVDYFHHFGELIPEHVLHGDRDIVLVDRSVPGSGQSVRVLGELLREYLRVRGSPVEVELVGFSERPLQEGVNWIDISGADAMRGLNDEAWEDNLSEFGQHYIGRDNLATLKARPQYGEMRRFMRERMRTDRMLDKMLQKIPGLELVGAEPVEPEPAPKLSALKKRLGAEPLLTVQSKHGTFNYLSRVEYKSLRDGALELLRRYPPEQYSYLGVGRSSTALVALFSVFGATVAYFPADGLGKKEPPNAVALFAPYFQRFAPAGFPANGKKLLLVKHSDSGDSLDTLQNILGQYLRNVRSNAQVEVVNIGNPAPGTTRPFLVAGTRALTELDGDQYKAVSPLPHFKIGETKDSRLKPNPEFDRYLDAVRLRALEDEDLQDRLPASLRRALQ